MGGTSPAAGAAPTTTAGSISQPPPSLQYRMWQATKGKHSYIDGAITKRLPSCLPPEVNDPRQYTLGMTVFFHMFASFETEWERLLDASSSMLDERRSEVLSRLSTENLKRSSLLKSNLRLLETRLGPKFAAQRQDLFLDSLFFGQRIKSSIRQRPHLLLACTWTMYLAIFNGGRYIYKFLDGAGDRFWQEGEDDDDKNNKNGLFYTDNIKGKSGDGRTCTEEGSKDKASKAALSFWYIADTSDSANKEIHDTFKKNFDYAAELLTAEEEEDVVNGSVDVFDICAEMVQYLDDKHLNLSALSASSYSSPTSASTPAPVSGEADESLKPHAKWMQPSTTTNTASVVAAASAGLGGFTTTIKNVVTSVVGECLSSFTSGSSATGKSQSVALTVDDDKMETNEKAGNHPVSK